MRYLKDDAFVIRRINVGEADRFITLFTRENGKIDVLAKGVRKITSRRASFLEPLNLIHFTTIKTKKNHVLTEIELIESAHPLKQDLVSMQLSFVMCELVDKLCAPWQKNQGVFDLFFHTLDKLQVSRERSYLFDFQVDMLSLLGFWDGRKSFRDEIDLQHYIEHVAERKIQSHTVFSTKI